MSTLFHSLVVCGAGITLLQCGGRAQVSGDEPTNGGAAGSTGGGASSAQGGVVAGGGTLSMGGPVSTGGTFSVGGSMPTGTGGSFGGTSAWQQWDCTPDNVHGCASAEREDTSFALGQSCGVNPSRPRSAKDCAAGQVFSCFVGELNGESGPFNCACLPRTDDVPCPCPSSDLGCSSSYKCSDVQVQCGCAHTCILVK